MDPKITSTPHSQGLKDFTAEVRDSKPHSLYPGSLLTRSHRSSIAQTPVVDGIPPVGTAAAKLSMPLEKHRPSHVAIDDYRQEGILHVADSPSLDKPNLQERLKLNTTAVHMKVPANSNLLEETQRSDRQKSSHRSRHSNMSRNRRMSPVGTANTPNDDLISAAVMDERQRHGTLAMGLATPRKSGVLVTTRQRRQSTHVNQNHASFAQQTSPVPNNESLTSERSRERMRAPPLNIFNSAELKSPMTPAFPPDYSPGSSIRPVYALSPVAMHAKTRQIGLSNYQQQMLLA